MKPTVHHAANVWLIVFGCDPVACALSTTTLSVVGTARLMIAAQTSGAPP